MQLREVDAIGLLCPLPVLKARKALEALPSGALIQVSADDPVSVVDMPHFCNEAGHRLIRQSEVDGVFHFVIQRK